jgi:hypothetical protein
MATYSFEGIPDYGKVAAISIALIVGVFVCDFGRVTRLHFHWSDVPMVIWCLVPMASSLTNGLGFYNGLSAVLGSVLTWGVPYFIGRLYFGDWEGARSLALAIFIGGLLYVPLCLYEVRMSPQLHTMVYGYHQHVFAQTRRLGGWRPVVFMQHGLAVGMWMTAACMAGVAIWRGKWVRSIAGVSIPVLLAGLLITTVLCKSFGALLLLAIGLGTVWVCKLFRSVVPLVLLVSLVPAYVVSRVAFDWKAEPVIEILREIHEERADSMEGRIAADAKLTKRALERPFFGWGGWNRFRSGSEPVLPDTLWAITLGQKGLIGLTSLFLTLLLPISLALARIGRMGGGIRIDHQVLADATALILIVFLFVCDSLSNAMVNPVFIVAAGGLAAWPGRSLHAGECGVSVPGS